MKVFFLAALLITILIGCSGTSKSPTTVKMPEEETREEASAQLVAEKTMLNERGSSILLVEMWKQNEEFFFWVFKENSLTPRGWDIRFEPNIPQS